MHTSPFTWQQSTSNAQSENEKHLRENHAKSESIYSRLYYQFFDVSPIHGCSFVARRRHPREGVMWLLIIAVFLGLSAHDVLLLVSNYMDTPTAITVQVRHNITMHYDDVAICFDVFRDVVASTVEEGFDESLFNKTLERLAQIVGTAGGWNMNILQWRVPVDDPHMDVVIKATYLMLVSYGDVDNGVFNVPIGETAIRAVEIVENFYIERKFDLFQLINAVGKYLYRQMLETNATCPVLYKSANGRSQCIRVGRGNVSSVVWLGYAPSNFQDDVCLRLEKGAVELFESNEDWLILTQFHVSRPSTSPLVWNDPASIPFIDGFGPPALWIDMRGGDGLIDSHYIDSAYWQSEGTSSYVGIELMSVATMYNKSNRPCFDYSEVDCAEECIISKRLVESGCWSLVGLAIRHRPPDAVPCMMHYPGFNNSVPVKNTFGECIRRCQQPHCTSKSFQFRVSSYPTSALSRATDARYGTNLTIIQSRFIYSHFVEYPTMDFAALLAAIGGSIGLWLGGSLIAFLHIPVYAVDAFCRVLRHHQKAHRRIQQPESSTIPSLPTDNIQADNVFALTSERFWRQTLDG